MNGKLTVSDPGYVDEVSRWFVQTLQSQGVPFNPDFNGPSQNGVGYFQFTYGRGQRVSAASAFIDPLRNNPNLSVRVRTQVQKLMVEKGQVVGVIATDRT